MSQHCCKVGRVAEQYGLSDRLEELLDTWERADGPGVRELIKEFNHQIIEVRLTQANRIPLEGEVETIYEKLSGNKEELVQGDIETSRVSRRLREYGLDPDELQDDCPSYRTLLRHIKQCEGRSRNQTSLSADEAARQTQDRIEALKQRLRQVASKGLRDLASAEHITLGEFEVVIHLRVRCCKCNRTSPIRTVVREGCNCSAEAGDAGSDLTAQDQQSSNHNQPATGTKKR